MEKKQTAVQSLISELTGQILHSTLTGEKLTANEWKNIFDNHLAMEEAQIIHSYVSKGYLLEGNSYENLYKEAQEYYNFTYKSK